MAVRSTQGWKESSSVIDDLLAYGFVDGAQVPSLGHSSTELSSHTSTRPILKQENIPDGVTSSPISSDSETKRDNKYNEIMSKSSIGHDLAASCKELTCQQAWLIEKLRYDEDLSDVYDGMVVATMRDLGGQEVFIPTHSALMPNSSKYNNTAYIVMSNLARDPDHPFSSTYRASAGDTILPRVSGRIHSDSDYIRYCLSAIKAAHGNALPTLYLGKTEGVASPPVFFAASHAGEENAANNVESHEAILRDIIQSKGFEAHVVPPEIGSSRLLFPVDNKKSGSGHPDEIILLIKTKIEQMAVAHSLSQDPIPLRWLVLWKMVCRLSRMPQYKVVELKCITILAQYVCEIETTEEVELGLHCLVSYGLFLYYPDVPKIQDVVFTDPQWVVNGLSAFVTIIDPLHLPPILRQDASNLLKTGLMSWPLAEHQLHKAGIRQENVLSVLGLFQLFDVAFPSCDKNKIEPGSDLFVPCMIAEDHKGVYFWQEDTLCQSRPPSLIFRSVGVDILLETLYFRLVACAASCMTTMSLTRDRAVFCLPDDLNLELVYYQQRYIIATVNTVDNLEIKEKVYVQHCSDIREFLSRHLENSKRMGMAGLQLELCCLLPQEERSSGYGPVATINPNLIISLCNYNVQRPLLISGSSRLSSRMLCDKINMWYGKSPIKRRERNVSACAGTSAFFVDCDTSFVEQSAYVLADWKRMPTDEEVANVACNVGLKWKKVARQLKFRRAQIEEIECQHSMRLSEQAQAMLETWIDEHGEKATVGRLYKALIQAKCRRRAEKVFGSMKRREIQ